MNEITYKLSDIFTNGRTKIKGCMKRIDIARIAMEQTQRQIKILLNKQTGRRKNKYAYIRK